MRLRVSALLLGHFVDDPEAIVAVDVSGDLHGRAQNLVLLAVRRIAYRVHPPVGVETHLVVLVQVHFDSVGGCN